MTGDTQIAKRHYAPDRSGTRFYVVLDAGASGGSPRNAEPSSRPDPSWFSQPPRLLHRYTATPLDNLFPRLVFPTSFPNDRSISLINQRRSHVPTVPIEFDVNGGEGRQRRSLCSFFYVTRARLTEREMFPGNDTTSYTHAKSLGTLGTSEHR